MTVAELVAQLSKLPLHKQVICQVVGMNDSRAWNMHFAVTDIDNTSLVQLRVFHPRLLALPKKDDDCWNSAADH